MVASTEGRAALHAPLVKLVLERTVDLDGICESVVCVLCCAVREFPVVLCQMQVSLLLDQINRGGQKCRHIYVS